ncbi:MAG TPA: Calx-beta domain-containing protein, partial [Verrucomicrobiota bacterium]|nr:Calx-beta domain-containing protein [Verrucomicrobiota bacterium]
MKRPLLSPWLSLLLGLRLIASPGDPDPTFNIGTGFTGSVNAVVRQSDGKILAAGDFATINGEARPKLVRLESSGAIDPTFLVVTLNNSVESVAVQADGKILIGGAFTVVNGVAHNRIARLNADGTLDAAFDPGSGFNSTVQAVAVQADGRILVGGYFSRYQNVDRPYLVRLLTDGTFDASYLIGAGPNNTVRALRLQPDGRLLVGGQFTTIDGLPCPRLARRLSTGAADPAFDPGAGANGEVRAIALEADGRLLVGGSFTQFNGTTRNRLVRLSAEGLVDPSLAIGTGPNNTVESIALQADGKILVGGSFTQYAGLTHNRLVRLLPEGGSDPAFDLGSGFNNTVRTLWVQSDGNLLVGGDFTQFNGLDYLRLIRLQTATSASGGALEFAQGRFEYFEGEGTVTIQVVRLGSTARAVAVDYTTANGTATVADYTPAGGTLNFAIGQSSATFTVTLLDEPLSENDETVLVNLMNPSGGAELGSRPGAVLAILNDDFPEGQGMVDWDYSALGANGAVLALTPTAEGKVMVGGAFTFIAGANRNGFARLLADGTVDPTFNPAAHANDTVESVALQPDGKILIGGAFTVVNGVARNRIARLNADGTLDAAFDPG